MFICQTCLAERYDWPKWDQTFSRSVGPCEVCHKSSVCVDVHHSHFVLKDVQTEWACAAASLPGVGDECHCNPIKITDEVIKVNEGPFGGIHFYITHPNPKAVKPQYVRSFRCARAMLMHYLTTHCEKPESLSPKMAPIGTPLPCCFRDEAGNHLRGCENFTP